MDTSRPRPQRWLYLLPPSCQTPTVRKIQNSSKTNYLFMSFYCSDPFNFQVSTPPVSYCTNIGTNQQILDSQQWPGCHSMARIGVPMANPIRTGVFKLQMGTRCIHISGGGFGTPVVRWIICIRGMHLLIH